MRRNQSGRDLCYEDSNDSCLCSTITDRSPRLASGGLAALGIGGSALGIGGGVAGAALNGAVSSMIADAATQATSMTLYQVSGGQIGQADYNPGQTVAQGLLGGLLSAAGTYLSSLLSGGCFGETNSRRQSSKLVNRDAKVLRSGARTGPDTESDISRWLNSNATQTRPVVSLM